MINRKSTNNLGCKRYQALIQKRLDGEITPKENLDLDEHLADCPHCIEELTAFASVTDILNEARENPVEVPKGFFESLSEGLGKVKPAYGLAGLLASPFFSAHRQWALGTASFVLVAVLTLSVGLGVGNRVDKNSELLKNPTASKVVIDKGSGQTMIWSGDEGDTEGQLAALEDLDRAYREALGLNESESNEGYIHTSWRGGESATPIH